MVCLFFTKNISRCSIFSGLPGSFNDIFTLPTSLTFVRTFSFTLMEENEKTNQISDISGFDEFKDLIKNTVEKTFQAIEDGVKNVIGDTVEKTKDAHLEQSLTIKETEDKKVIEMNEIKLSDNENIDSLIMLQKILLKNEYTDVILKSSNGNEIKTYRYILAAHSSTFKTIFDNTDTVPVEIECEKFNSKTILHAITFLYGKDKQVDGEELNLLDFANEYGIESLKVSLEYFCNIIPKFNKNHILF